MINENQEYRNPFNSTLNVLFGMLVGGLAGAVTMLLLAPQSGRETRIQIQKKGIELRDQTSKIVGDTMSQVRSSANRVTIGGQKKAEELLQQGQALVVEQLEHVSEAAKAGKKAIERI